MAMTQKSLEELWLKALVFVLFGYVIGGKEFAYTFIGEMVLFIGCLILLRSQRLMLIFVDPTLMLWAVFAFWGVLRTVPFVGKYGFPAIRDGVLYGYGLLAVLLVAFVNNSNQISRFFKWYKGTFVWLVPGLFIVLALQFTIYFRLPAPPWAPEPYFPVIKGGDGAVSLAGIGIFSLIFADEKRAPWDRGASFYSIIGYTAFVGSTLIVLVAVRSGFVAIAVPLIVLSVMKFRKVGWKTVSITLFVAILIFGFSLSNIFSFEVRGRQFNSDFMEESVKSIFGFSNETELEGTKEWRLGWWKNIVDYTVFGPYFWTGKGFGINLALEDGPPGMSTDQIALRSPHNGSMTVLARMGVPGLILWVAINLSFVLRLLLAYLRANRARLRFWSSVNLWISLFLACGDA